ncbi:MAG: 50S ribosomal protein L6 [Candidatus Diapherotrites archaeon]|nr:50S ribosomal protein L6 [Candidatus Diapherotrites archaeon]
MAKKKVIEISVPEGITARMEGNKLTMSGNSKEITKQFKINLIDIKIEDSKIILEAKNTNRKIIALLNTYAAHINNMITGLKKGFYYKLAIVHSHFPMKVSVQGDVVEINNFCGEKTPRYAKILPNATVEVKGKEIIVKSHDKEAAAQTAANLENATKVRGKDERRFQDGIYIVEKGVVEEGGNKDEQK